MPRKQKTKPIKKHCKTCHFCYTSSGKMIYSCREMRIVPKRKTPPCIDYDKWKEYKPKKGIKNCFACCIRDIGGQECAVCNENFNMWRK